MRNAAMILVLFSLGCASGGGGGVVDGTRVGGPFSFAGGGFTSENPQFGRYPSTEELMVIFENVSGRPQTVESIQVRQVNQSSAPLLVDDASQRIGRMIDSGEELEVTMLVRVTPQRIQGGVALGGRGVNFDIILRTADGTSYRYPVQVPMKMTIGVGP
jgi:hypothetical protein